MKDMRYPVVLYLVLLALGLLQWVHVYPQLPAMMASHFSGRGIPNGWQPKETFFLLMGFVALVPVIPAFLTPRRLASMPPEKINLPHKSYWLAEERREGTWRFIAIQMGWFGCALLFLLLYATSEAINANLPGVGKFHWQGMWWALGGFVLFCTLWIVHFLHHFYSVPDSDSSLPSR